MTAPVPTERKIRWWLFIFFAACYLLTASGRIEGGDAGTMYQVTRNMVECGTVAITGQFVSVPVQTYQGFLPTREYKVETSTVTSGGRLGYGYSRYGWGQSLASVPLYLIGRILSGLAPALGPQFLERMCVQFFNALVLSAAAVVLFTLARAFDLPLRLSAGLAGVFSFGTYVWPYVKTFYSEPATTLLLLLAFLALRRYEMTGRTSHVFWAGVWFGVSLSFRITSFLAVPALGVYFLMAVRDWRRHGLDRNQATRVALLGCLGCAPGVLLVMLYSWLRFGTLFASGYTNLGWDTPILNGLYGLLFSPGKGLFIYSPVLLLSLGGLIVLWHSRRGLALAIVVLSASYIIFHAPYSFWTGGWNWGPRFLVPVVPFLLLSVGVLLEQAKTRTAILLFALLLALSVAIQLPAVLVNHSRDMIALSEQYDRFYDKTVYEVPLSPAVRQWPVAAEVLERFAHNETRAEARRVMAGARADWVRAGVAQDRAMTGLTVESEFIRNNVPDFWWVYLCLVGVSPSAIAASVGALIAAAGVAAGKAFAQIRQANKIVEQEVCA